MSTRGVIGFYVDGKTEAFYNHSDSYPSELGMSMARQITELLSKHSIEDLKNMCRSVKAVKEDYQPTPKEMAKISATDPFINYQELDMYSTLRSMQGRLDMVLECQIAVDYKNFMKDSLFCEWAYIMNLDQGVLEVYKGFQKSNHALGRYAKGVPNETGYYPVALVHSIPLDENLITNMQGIVAWSEREDAE
jgi:hypothetical protein